MNKFLGSVMLAGAMISSNPVEAQAQDTQFSLEECLAAGCSVELHNNPPIQEEQLSESQDRFTQCVQEIMEQGSKNFARCLLPDREVYITKRGEICNMPLAPRILSREADNQQEDELNYTPIPPQDEFTGFIS